MDDLPALVKDVTTWLVTWAPLLALVACGAAFLAALASLRRRDDLGSRRGFGIVLLVAVLFAAAVLVVVYSDGGRSVLLEL